MRILLSAAAACMLLSGCFGGGGDGGDGGNSGGSNSMTNSTTPGILPQPQEVDIEVAAVGAYPVNPAFDPESLTVPAGALVHVTFNNDETTPQVQHNWVVDGIPNATSSTIGPGASTSLDFTAPAQAGTFDYFCAIGDHRARGMEGTLSVTVS